MLPFLTGNKGRRTPPRGRGEDELDEALSTTSFDSYDTFASGIDAANGEARSPSVGESEGMAAEETDKAVESFQDGVEMLTEKR